MDMFGVQFKGHGSTRTPLTSNQKLTLHLIRCRLIFLQHFLGKKCLISCRIQYIKISIVIIMSRFPLHPLCKLKLDDQDFSEQVQSHLSRLKKSLWWGCKNTNTEFLTDHKRPQKGAERGLWKPLLCIPSYEEI